MYKQVSYAAVAALLIDCNLQNVLAVASEGLHIAFTLCDHSTFMYSAQCSTAY